MKATLYAAGLGDIIRTIYLKNGYQTLSETKTRIAVVVASHNPYSIEIFRHHQNSSNFVLYDLGHKYEEFISCGLRGPEITQALLEFVDIPISSVVNGRPEPDSYKPVFNSPDSLLSSGHIIFCPFAGTNVRTFSPEFTRRLTQVLRRIPRQVYLISRGYPRMRTNGDLVHSEEDGRAFEGDNIQVLDNLTVPATLQLVRSCSAYVGSWSSLQQAAWFEKKPVAVFYPNQWHDVTGRTDYAFGLDRQDCLHADYETASMDTLEKWLHQWTANH